MTVTIHRGTHQIGGCVTELRTEHTRILIDLGAELPGDGHNGRDEFFLEGITQGRAECDGIFFTHYHGDHVGLIDRVLPGIPLYMGKTAGEIFKMSRQRGANCLPEWLELCAFSPAVPVKVGDISVTPFFIDHSAFDAYMFLIEAEGARVLHTGDFRLHGFRGNKTIPMLQKYVGRVDWLICEGTALGRAGENFSEHDLQREARHIMEAHKRMFVLCASTNIDRIAAFYHARPDCRPAICDDYQRELLKIVESHHGEASPLYRFPFLYPYSKKNQKLLRLMEERGFLIFVRQGRFGKAMLERYGDSSVLVYSMWHGYREGAAAKADLEKFLEGRQIVELHSSGHAGGPDLAALWKALAPQKGVIPIHTEAPELLQKILPEGARIICPADGEPVQLNETRGDGNG